MARVAAAVHAVSIPLQAHDVSPEDFMAAAPAPPGGNTPWAQRIAADLRGVIGRASASAPRSVQAHLGPSEVGETCHRQVVGKLAGAARTNHVADPWPSVVGTAVHAWLATAFDDDNARSGILRWVTETRVVPHPAYPGTADLYDAQERAVLDWKCLGPTSLAKIRTGNPPRKYVVQLLLYGAGYRNLGLPVDRVAIAALPRTASTLDTMYVWDHPCTPADEALVAEVLDAMAFRQALAAEVRARRMSLRDVPNAPSDESCYFCFLYRPQSARDGGPGCPGTLT